MTQNVHTFAVVFALAVGAVEGPGAAQQLSGESVAIHEVLKSSTDREALERAAIRLARSGNPKDLVFLGQLLRDREFLARLDDLSNLKTRHLGRVMAALANNPIPQVVELCMMLAEDPVFVAEGDRKSFVLELLASVKPMSEATIGVFQRANEEGYFAFNARLLAENGSPRALSLFESMILDREVDAESRVQCLHQSVLPRRTNLAILRVADRILSRALERAIATGVIESVFDFRQQWFSIESGISNPPAWQSASDDSLRYALELAKKALSRRDLPPALRGTVSRAGENVVQILNARRK